MGKIKAQYMRSYRDRHKIILEGTVRGKTYRARYVAVFDMLIENGIKFGASIWDLGCGDGAFATWRGSQFGFKMFNLDLSIKSLLQAGYHTDTCSVQGDIENLPIKTNAVRWIVSIETLEHLEDIDKGLREIRRCLTKEGIAIITIPSPLNPRNINIYGSGSYFRGLVKALPTILSGVKKSIWIDNHGNSYPHYEYTKWMLRKKIKAMDLNLIRAKKIPVILNSKHDSLIERVINNVTGNRLGECHIMAVIK